jgi:hypothetical protein
LLRLVASALFAGDLRRRLRDAVRRLVVTLALLIAAAVLLFLALLYFIHAFFIWLDTLLPAWAAALATGGLVLLIAVVILVIVQLMGRRRPASAGQPVAALKAVAASHELGKLAGRLSPRTIAFGLGILAAAMMLFVDRPARRDDVKKKP